ncbi:DUF4247 domain-containing protein [Planococcus lenghuensis]|uniref:DUF4247 domain-containing protein n=1 Tax=Planococcus lenghuensis TaxID=2213202 RepID=A0A1Q2KUZ5_9BACL|nr:DUF4247 domain-containing protein [Planococcus lenghuensis]AQQ52009.1 hypothetical protein B0X71_01975 [Planococcus lenghuensis]
MRHKLGLALIIMTLLLAGCGAASFIEDQYALVDIVTDAQGEESRVYRAPDSTIAAVVAEIDSQLPAEQISEEIDGKVVMIYEDRIIQVMEDVSGTGDTLIEVSTEEFVENNYGTNFFLIYGLASLADDFFDIKKKKQGSYLYSGYINNGRYIKNAGGTGSIRFGSPGTDGIRGGGPGTGK